MVITPTSRHFIPAPNQNRDQSKSLKKCALSLCRSIMGHTHKEEGVCLASAIVHYVVFQHSTPALLLAL
jgi:hypothetical protein